MFSTKVSRVQDPRHTSGAGMGGLELLSSAPTFPVMVPRLCRAQVETLGERVSDCLGSLAFWNGDFRGFILSTASLVPCASHLLWLQHQLSVLDGQHHEGWAHLAH